MSEDEKTIEDVTEIINRCKECKFATCEQCEINWTQIKTVEHLLDLYKQEKELHKEYEDKYLRLLSSFNRLREIAETLRQENVELLIDKRQKEIKEGE